ncbi:hypothetical protein MXD81_01025 [Microbacteriaceae bacterium K1510]|nr:hypothetical protein [Microbacteriaceae bacterium K1510]
MGFRIIVLLLLLLTGMPTVSRSQDWNRDNRDDYRRDQRWDNQRWDDQRWDRGSGNRDNGNRDSGNVTETQKRACEPEVFRLCSYYIPNRDAITTCLHNNISKLNADCRAVMEGRLR